MLTGNVTGNLIDNLTGSLTGRHAVFESSVRYRLISGQWTGYRYVTGHVTRPVTDNLTGQFMGQVTDHMPVDDSLSGTVTAHSLIQRMHADW